MLVMKCYMKLVKSALKLRHLRSHSVELGFGSYGGGPAGHCLRTPACYLFDEIGNVLHPLGQLMNLLNGLLVPRSHLPVLSRRMVVEHG